MLYDQKDNKKYIDNTTITTMDFCVRMLFYPIILENVEYQIMDVTTIKRIKDLIIYLNDVFFNVHYFFIAFTTLLETLDTLL